MNEIYLLSFRFKVISLPLCFYPFAVGVLAPIVQRADNFIQWISHYATVSICAKISVFRCKQANMHTPMSA